MKRIDTAERRARIAVRHHLAPEHRADTMVEAARGVVCLHATDPATVYLSTWARLTAPTFDMIERELYEERRLIRMLAMRRTLFVVPTDEAPVLHAAASLDVARVERRRNEQLVDQDVRGDAAVRAVADLADLAVEQVRTAIRYYADHLDEIDEQIHQNQEIAEESEQRWHREQHVVA
jgi:hypothetical protein